MSTPLPPPYYGPGATLSAGTVTVPFDVAGASAALDRATATLKPGQHGALTVQMTKSTGFGAGLVLRGPFNMEALGTLSRPPAGGWGWSVGGRISFLKSLPDDAVKPIVLEPPPPPLIRIWNAAMGAAVVQHAAPTWSELYGLFRKQGHGKVKAAIKASRLATGAEVTVKV
jgi:hypothetical protein